MQIVVYFRDMAERNNGESNDTPGGQRPGTLPMQNYLACIRSCPYFQERPTRRRSRLANNAGYCRAGGRNLATFLESACLYPGKHPDALIRY